MWTRLDEECCIYLLELPDSDFEQYALSNRLNLSAVAAVACRRGNAKVLTHCIRCGLNVSTTRVTPHRVPLASLAAMFDNLNVLKILLFQGCCLYQADELGRTPFSLMSFDLAIAAACEAVA